MKKKIYVCLGSIVLCIISFMCGYKLKELTSISKESIYIADANISKYNFVISENNNNLIIQRCNADGYLLEENIYVLDENNNVKEIQVTKQYENSISAINKIKELKKHSHLEYIRQKNLIKYIDYPQPSQTKDSILNDLYAKSESIKGFNVINNIK